MQWHGIIEQHFDKRSIGTDDLDFQPVFAKLGAIAKVGGCLAADLFS